MILALWHSPNPKIGIVYPGLVIIGMKFGYLFTNSIHYLVLSTAYAITAILNCDGNKADITGNHADHHAKVTIWSGLACIHIAIIKEFAMSALIDITFFEVCMALVTVAIAERALLAFAPIEMVGPNGWLIRADVTE